MILLSRSIATSVTCALLMLALAQPDAHVRGTPTPGVLAQHAQIHDESVFVRWVKTASSMVSCTIILNSHDTRNKLRRDYRIVPGGSWQEQPDKSCTVWLEADDKPHEAVCYLTLEEREKVLKREAPGKQNKKTPAPLLFQVDDYFYCLGRPTNKTMPIPTQQRKRDKKQQQQQQSAPTKDSSATTEADDDRWSISDLFAR